ncbi:DNA mismatch repair endonuclease MutL [bacterium]|nr:DNA mismatch repair endonuclease MutL [bacterium]
MTKIKQLSLHEAQKIAAGEVVERPANVVKELIENALDAGATQITLYLENGGKKLIRIVDNGCGMSQEDAHLCFNQHATSKISSVNDLESLVTFGFRGEALASIAAVSNVTLTTKENINGNEASSGIKLELDAGNILKKESVSCRPGTSISIENLFFNVPARQKFLKKKETESRHIIQLVHAFCLDYLSVHFKFFQENKELINCPPTETIETRIAQLWDHVFSKQMITIDTEKTTDSFKNIEGLKISGAISNHQYFRYDRNNIFLFVNKRWIKDIQLSRALLRGYQNVLPPARYPAACIFIEIDSQQVDINIHPRKEEVQFLHPRKVANLLQNTVKKALEDNLSSQIQQTVTFKKEIPYPSSFAATSQATTSYTAPQTYKPFNFDAAPPVHSPVVLKKSIEKDFNSPDKDEQKKQTIIDSYETTKIVQKNYELIGQYKKTYILIEKKDGLFLVDQHAAHERILYELFSKRFKDVATVTLMFPEIFSVSLQDMQTIAPHLAIFKQNGIEIEPFGDKQLIIKSTPVHIKNIKLSELVQQVASWIKEFEQPDQEAFFKAINEKMHAQMACKAAIKAGDILTKEQMEKLLEDLEKTNNRLTCPHGRPTGWLLSVYEIEKKFKRITS